MNKLGKLFIASALFAIISVPLFAGAASAVFFEAGEELFLSVPFDDDLYAAGCPVIIDENIEGDASVAGCIVTISADISQDLNVGAGVITIDGTVGDDLRAGGGEVTINSIVGDDLFVGGGTVNISRSAVIKGDLIIGGGRVNMNGTVEGDLKMGSGMVIVDGPVLGEATVYGGSVMLNSVFGGNSVIAADEIVFGSSAQLGGDLNYWTKDGELDLTEVSIAGTATFDPELSTAKYTDQFDFDEAELGGIFASIAFGFMMFHFLSAALIILLLSLSTKKFFKKAAMELEKEFSKSLLAGFLYFVFVPIVALLVMVTVIGIPLGLITLLLYAITVYLASIVSSIVLAHWVVLHWKLKWSKVAHFFLSLLIYVLLTLICLIPIVGWITKIVIVFAAFGAHLLHKFKLWKQVA
ncbi:hypothetical protein HOD30_01300 [Candidatus Peregrinibacteria bacterium]|jgi:hypothetical protein|nr:hypothetical protein [Candidatus Peregrinibacteria bacterium]MBT4632261.1 hypothetical protein [Candidatus Peregrinibacteria bacterium]MBT5824328.1 hypothetical protein [Candidatus Peregrinibacteria bacterium]